MKHIALLAFTAGLAACGHNSDSSDLAAQVSKRLPNAWSFSVDRRPADGNFELITIEKDQYGTYSAHLQVITAGFGFPVSDTTEELGTGLSCAERKLGRNLLKLKCSVDLRPADGALIELTLTKNSDGLYDATLRRATYGTLIGPATDETNEIAFGLSYKR